MHELFLPVLQWDMQFSDLLCRTGLIAAHRGNRALAPENTMAAFHKSVGCCDFIELDVQLSRDAVPVVIHDDTLERTSNVASLETFRSRKPWRVCDFTLAELKTFDYGSWFEDSDPFDARRDGDPGVDAAGYAGEPIPTLEEVLHFASAEDMLLNVEIKDMHDLLDDELVVAAVAAAIEASGCVRRVLISSFYHPYLPLMQKALPEVATVALQEGAHPADTVAYLKDLGVNGYHCDDAIVTETIVGDLKRAGFFTGVYTVNDPRRQRELFCWGVNALFTDRPLLAKRE